MSVITVSGLRPRDARLISFARVLVVGQRLFSVGSGGALPRWDCPTFVSRKTTTEKKDLSPAPARVGAFCERSPRIRPHLVVAPKARRGGVWGCVIALQTPRQFRAASCDRFAARLRLGLPALTRGASPPRRGASARVVPKVG